MYAAAKGAGSVSIGRYSYGVGVNSTTLGSYAWGRGTEATVVGNHAYGYGEQSVTIGTHAVTDADMGISIGNRSRVFSEGNNGNAGIAIGNQATAEYWNAMALGTGSQVRGFHSTALGAYARIGVPRILDANGISTNSFGSDNKIRNDKGQVIYERVVQADGLTSDADGMMTVKEYEPGTTIVKRTFKVQEVSKVDQALAFGNNATVENEKIQYTEGGIKKEKTASSNGSIAIGANARVKGSQNSVALGLNSKVVRSDTETKSTAAFTGDENNDPGNGVVSIGTIRNASDGNGVTRRIVGVAGGQNDFDAVNVKQLKAAVKYYKTNSTETNNRTVNNVTDVSANYNGEGATGAASVTLGSYTKASGDYSTAIGRDVITSGKTAVGVGTNVTVSGEGSVGMGFEAKATAGNAIAIGRSVTTSGSNSFGAGSNVTVSNNYAVGLGYQATASGANAIAIGSSGQSGANVQATASDAIAIGTRAKGTASAAVAVGRFADAQGENAVALGNNTVATSQNSVAIGESANVEAGQGSIALGWNSKVTANDVKYHPTTEGKTKASPYLLNDDVDKMRDADNGVVAIGRKRTSDDGSNLARRIVGVAGGYNDYDAVNVKQLKAASWGLQVQKGSATKDVTPVGTGDLRKITLKAGDNVTLDNTNGVVTINASGGLNSITSNNTDVLGVSTTAGAVTLTPKVATTITGTGTDANKLVTSSVVNTAINNIPITSFKADAGGGTNVEGVFTPTSSKKQVNITGAGSDGTTRQTWTQGSARFDSDNIGTHVNSDGRILVGLKNKIAVNEVATYNYASDGVRETTQGPTLSFTGLDMKNKKITNVADGEINATSKDAINGSQLHSKLAEKANVSALADKLDKTVERHIKSGSFNASTGTITLNMVDGNGSDKTTENVTIGGIPTKIGYKAGDEAKKEVAVGDGLHFKSGTGTVGSTGADAATTNAETVKQGIAISTAENGVVNIGLDAATRKIIDDAAKLGNTIADGRDGKVGTETGSIASTGLTKEDGLNSKDVTTKVNALRNGEAGTVVYTDDKGNRLVKANDGNWYDARVVNEKGAVKADGDIPAGVSKTAVTKPQARLVNPDGSTTIAAGTTGTTLSNIGSGAITATSTDAVTGSQLYTAKGELATALGGNATVGANGTLTGPTYSITKDDAAGGKDTATNVGDAITKLDTRINTVKENASKPLTFTGDDNQGVARKLDTTLTVKGGANVDTATTTMTAGVNIRVEKDPTANANGLTVKLADTLTKMKGISGNGTDDLVIKNGDKAVITVKPGTGTDAKGTVDFGGTKVTGIGDAKDNTDATNKKYVDDAVGKVSKIGYKAGDEAKKEVAVGDGLHFKSGTGTVGSTGADAATTNAETVKQGIAISTAENGVVNIGLDAATRKIIDDAAKLGNTIADGRDGKVGTETGSIASTGLTKEDGLNSKDVTTKVNALRNGEAGTVVYTDDKGNRLVKANDGNWYDARVVNEKGAVKADGDIPAGVSKTAVTKPQARLVNPDGSTTIAAGTTGTTLSNIGSGAITATSTDAVTGSQLYTAKGELATALGGNATVGANGTLTGPTYSITKDDAAGGKDTATNVGDAITKLDTRINTVKENASKPLTFTGDDNQGVARKLDTTLTVKGGANVDTATTTMTAGVNIRVEKDPTANANGLTVKLADTLTGMNGITAKSARTGLTLSNGGNPTAVANATGNTEVTINESGTTFTNAQPVDPAVAGSKATTSTVTLGKDGTAEFKHATAGTTDNMVTIDSKSGTVTAGKESTKQVTINGTDGTITTGNTVVNGSSMTITEGTITTVTKAGETEYKDGDDVTTVDTAGVSISDGTADVSHTATESTFNNDTKHATYSANGATIHDGTNTATHTATGSRFEDDDKHVVTTNATGVTVTDGTNNVTVAANGITLTPSDAGTGKVSLTTAGLNNGGNRITNVGTPTDDTDAVNKVYVDARGTLRYAADTTVDDNNNKVENHTVSMLDGTLRIKGTENKVVTKATKDGITIDLAEAVNDKLAQLDAKNSDGRDGKLGSEAGAIASTGLTNEDGLNEKTTTYKVNALRNGEAGSVVYTDDAGNRLVKAVDGKYYRAEAVKRDGTLKDVADLPKGVTLAPVDNPQARVVNPDGSTKSPTVFGNVASPIEKLIAKNDAGTDLDDQSYLNKLTTASKTNASKFAAVNATDLYTTTKEILAKGINFVGNDEAVNVHRNLGAMLKVQGTENYDRPTNETANTTNILVKANTNADGLNISLAKDLHGITSITNTDGTKDTTGTKLEIGDNGFTVTHTEAGTPDKISTMTVGKDGKTTFTNSESPANTISIDSKEGTVTVGNDVAGQSGNTNKVVVNGSNATITAGTADNKKVTVDGANGILTVGGDANSANATKVTVNGTDGSITTGKTTVDGTSVSIKDGDKTSTMNADGVTIEKGDDKTKVGSTGVSISDGKNAAIHSATESKFVADGKEASYSANGVHVTDGADKSVDITSDGTTITNGTMTTTTKAGESEYVNGNKVTIVNTDGMNVTDGTNTANYTASGITLSPSASGTGTVSLTTAGLNNGGNKIANVADATSDGDVVNLKQLKAGKTTFSVNDKDSATTNHNLVLTATKDATDGHINYDVKLADKVTLGKDGNAVTVDGTNGSIIAGKDDNAVTVDGANGKITTGHTEVTGSAVTIKDAANDAKKTTVDATGTIVTDGAGKTVTTNATSVTVAEGTDKKVVTTAESVTVTDGTTTTTATAGSTIYKNGTNETTVNTTNVVVKDGTATTTTKAGETKYEANGKNLTVNTDGITVKDGNNTGSINAMNSTFTNATNGTQVGPTLIRVNGENKNNAIEGGIAIGYHADVVTSVATATKETGNFITGLVNTTWNPKANGIVSGRVATEDQLKAVDDKVNKGRVFTADTKVGDKPLEAMVGLGDTLSIKGGADMTALTDKNIGVELKDAEMKDGKVVTPATMTVKLAKNVKMADGTTSYDSYVPEYKKDDKGNVVFDKNGLPTTIKEADGVTSKLQKDKEGNPYVLTRTVVDGKGTTYHHHNLDLTGKVQVDAQGQPVSGLVTTVNAEGSKYELRHIGKDSLVSLDKAGNPIVDVTTEVTSKGVQIIPGAHFNKAPVSLSANGLDNGGNRISNVAPGEAPTDAVNVGQVNSITTVLDRRINQTGAKAAAMAAMKPLMYDPIKKSQIMAGFGTQKGAQALALGVAHYFNEDVMVNMGLSVGAGDNMMNAGVTYRFGGDDSMIPERYKGGPISSIYVMQDEISALKAENEQVKSENAQIKADNSQVRADNERMKASYEKIMEDNAQMKQDNEEMKAQIKMLMAHMGIK